jgi:hypothetical protein
MNEHEPQFPRAHDANRPTPFVKDPPQPAASSWLRRWSLSRSRRYLLLLLFVLVLLFLGFTTEVIVDFWKWLVRQLTLGA